MKICVKTKCCGTSVKCRFISCPPFTYSSLFGSSSLTSICIFLLWIPDQIRVFIRIKPINLIRQSVLHALCQGSMPMLGDLLVDTDILPKNGPIWIFSETNHINIDIFAKNNSDNRYPIFWPIFYRTPISGIPPKLSS